MDNPVVLASLAFISVFLFFFGLQRIVESQRRVIGSRLEQYGGRAVVVPEGIELEGMASRAPGLDRMMSKSTSQQLALDLQRADLRLTPGEFIALNIGAAALGFLIAFALGYSNWAFGFLGGLLGFYLPRLQMKRMQEQRLNAFNNQLNDTLILLANSLRSGYSLQQAMEAVSHELPPPVATEFARVIREVSLGLNMEEALDHMFLRINSEDLDLIITAINIQHEVGGNLAEILDTIAHTIRERVRIKGQIRALTASQRLSGTVISLLPFALAAFMFIFNQNYFKRMWEESCGWIMMGVGVVMIGLGYFVIQRIVDIEV